MITLADYLHRRELLREKAPHYRQVCATCRQPEFSCYCGELRPFRPGLEIAILIHPIENRRRIATGRMSHLMLLGSRLIEGQDFSNHPEVNELLRDPGYDCRVLYPGARSFDLSAASAIERRAQLNPASGRRLLLFVIDGTWATARKTMRLSTNLAALPRLSFRPDRPSRFRVRKQPRAECFSTLEAIHQLLEYQNPGNPEHAGLLHVFEHMVEIQLGMIRASHASTRKVTYRREQNRKVLAGLGLLSGSCPDAGLPRTPQSFTEPGIGGEGEN